MAEKHTSERRSSQIVDLSSKKKGTSKKKTPKGFAPLVQQTINLSTPKVGPVDVESARPLKEDASKKSAKKEENQKRRPMGNYLADLIDPETLAKLRG